MLLLTVLPVSCVASGVLFSESQGNSSPLMPWSERERHGRRRFTAGGKEGVAARLPACPGGACRAGQALPAGRGLPAPAPACLAGRTCGH